ncbi:cyclic nucleotide-binding domain-containing protein [Leptobacterium flavescens]|uniref:Cyclic nucleotide-binding domain-containing protein n=1 Tax=Leptobacterium flavescens TaxID=472055 RepID=A0A6P0USM7_9FLAO|nr:Crp/Fnr family transcriptional regulator [Leptobacterium flavescens]NER15540.1 cyclic nucleotide-binding domain-containing protein [Leptobacterium flavescens]
MKSLWFLDDVDLFKIFCPHKYKGFKEKHSFDFYKKGDYIYMQEDRANKVYLINEGKIKIGYYTDDGEEVVTAILSKGDIFGEKAILGEEKRDEFARSFSRRTSICVLTSDVMQDMMRENQSFSLKIHKILGFRIKKLERRLQLLLFKDSKTRLLEFLLELYEEYGHCCPETGDKVIEHPYTQKDIAGLIGTSRSTLNIILNELRDARIVNFSRKEIRIINDVA